MCTRNVELNQTPQFLIETLQFLYFLPGNTCFLLHHQIYQIKYCIHLFFFLMIEIYS